MGTLPKLHLSRSPKGFNFNSLSRYLLKTGIGDLNTSDPIPGTLTLGQGCSGGFTDN